jgi:hypothetical protein
MSPTITAKSAIVGYTRSLAAEVAADNIQVNLVAPSMTETSLIASLPAALVKRWQKIMRIERYLHPLMSRRLCSFLCQTGPPPSPDNKSCWPRGPLLFFEGWQMSRALLLQTFGPVVFGLIFSASGMLAEQPKWLGRIAFLLAQLLQIYAFGYGSIAGIGLVVCVLSGFAVFAAAPSTSSLNRLAGCSAFFSIYMLYWAFEKYAVPLLFGAESTGDTLGSAYGVAWTIALVGISYIGFKFIHFFVDYRSGDIEHVEPLGFLSWLLFFPSIVARPMQRYQDWNDQFGVTGLTFDHAAWGLQRILFG